MLRSNAEYFEFNLSQSSKKKRNKRNISRLKIVLGAMSGKMIQKEAKIFFF